MNLEGKVAGYNKKTLVILLSSIIMALIVFYAGAQYEKHKLTSLGLAKSKSSSSANSGAKKSSQKGTSVNNANGNTSSGTNASNSSPVYDNSQNSTNSNTGIPN